MGKLIALTPAKKEEQVLVNVDHIIRVDKSVKGEETHSIVYLTGYDGMNLNLKVTESIDDIMRLANS